MPERTAGRLVFNIGEAFPAHDMVAVFLVTLATALNDLLRASRGIVGGDNIQPGRRDVDPAEFQLRLRASVSHVWELRESIRHAREDEKVEDFIQSLPPDARDALAVIQDPNKNEAPWISSAMRHIRNQANHYGGGWSWDDVQWAMRRAADLESAIEITSTKVAGMNFAFTDEIRVQHLTRYFPEYVDDPDAEVDEQTIHDRVRTLAIAASKTTSAAMTFTQLAVEAYIDRLDEGVVRPEADSG